MSGLGTLFGLGHTADDFHKQKRAAARSLWPELDADDLQQLGGGLLIHQPSGDLYRGVLHTVLGGSGIPMRDNDHGVDAWYSDATGNPIFLARPSGPKTIGDLEAHRAEEKRAAVVAQAEHDAAIQALPRQPVTLKADGRLRSGRAQGWNADLDRFRAATQPRRSRRHLLPVREA
jgi:hypothetical protein